MPMVNVEERRQEVWRGCYDTGGVNPGGTGRRCTPEAASGQGQNRPADTRIFSRGHAGTIVACARE